MDKITSYTYYNAYNTIKNITGEIVKDFRATDEDYTTSYFFPAANAKSCFYEEKVSGGSNCYNYVKVGNDCGKYLTKAQCNAQKGALGLESCPFEYDYYAYSIKQLGLKADTLPSIYELMQLWQAKSSELEALGIRELFSKPVGETYTSCHSAYSTANISSDCNMFFRGSDTPDTSGSRNYYCNHRAIMTVEFIPETPEPDNPDVPPGPGCTPTPCTGGNEFDTDTCRCVCKKTAPDVLPCGKEWSESQCQLVDITPWPPVCPAGQEFNPQVCGCVAIPPAIPRKGANYCKLFVSYANTTPSFIDGGEECVGDSIESNLTEFAGKKPDIVLRNGMSLYNVSQDPVQIPALNGNSKGNKYNQTYTKEDGTTATKEVDLDEYGYIIYIDVDGINGDGVLWDDVYKFYVTLSGLVIPAFDADNPETAGGDSRFHLQTSVSNEVILNNKRQTNWITKSKSFKESACTMGYINAATPYCSGVTANAACTSNQEDCHLRIVTPVKFFGP